MQVPPLIWLCAAGWLGGCGAAMPAAADDSGPEQTLGPATPDAGSDARPAADGLPADAGSPHAGASDGGVTFRYQPSWPGVVSVIVLGAPKGGKKWAHLVTLARDGSGAFTGAASLAPGEYIYLLATTGDDAQPAGASYVQYVLDPVNPDIRLCPQEAPSQRAFDPKVLPQPCAYLKVPAGPAAPVHHIRGVIRQDGAPAAGWLVELDTRKDDLHHFFANQFVTGADGTYDLVVASGGYELRVGHPTYWKLTNDKRDPLTARTILKAQSSLLTVTKDVTMDPLETGYRYEGNAPRMGSHASLPVSFAFSVLPYAGGAKLYVFPDWEAYIGSVIFESRSVTAAEAVSWDGSLSGGGALALPTTVYWTVQQNARQGATSPAVWYPQTMPFALTIDR